MPDAPQPDLAGLAALRAKYEEILRLRLAHDSGAEEDPRQAMAALASQFPGALREIDDLPMAEIRARVDALRAAEAGLTKIAPWMRATILFHTLTRGVLAAKRWLAGRKRIDPATREAFQRESSAFSYADEARAWSSDLDRIASPPRGRVTDLVYERMGALLHVSPREARILVFGLTRRERRGSGQA
jgi:hypothetical protein